MGKRRNKHDYDYIAKKLRKWEKKLYRETRSPSSYREDGSPPRYEYYDEDPMEEVGPEKYSEEDASYTSAVDPLISTSAVDPVPSTSAEDPIPSTSQTQVTAVDTEVIVPTDIPPSIELDSEILKIFGEDPSVEKIYGKEIQSDLAIRLQHVATKGLSSELRKELLQKYLPPSNCMLIDSPALNLEIKAAISEVVLKRDKGIEMKQKQLGCAISCLGSAITLMITKEEKDTELIKMLMDSIRLMCDNQHSDSVVRRNFILNNLKKEMKEQLQKTVVDKELFGSDLAETLKIAKSITKTGAELKSIITRPTITRSKTGQPPTQSTFQQRNNLNWRAPPPSRRQTGTQRTREPAPRNLPGNSSRGSYRGRQPTAMAPAPRTSHRSRR